MDMSLYAEFLDHKGRTIHKWKHYFPAYEAHFARFVNRPLTMLEIGCGDGGGLQLWKRYFGPFARIIGLDIEPKCADYQEDQITVRIGNQSDTGFLNRILEEFGPPDVIIDDGSHVMKDITASFTHLYPRMSPNGVYVVEDLHTAYWPEYGGGLRAPGSFMELCKDLIDQLHAGWSRGAMPANGFSAETLSMHFYNSLVAFERGRVPAPISPLIPPPESASKTAPDWLTARFL
jgi:SAM-dependent methyltransferase